MKRHLLAVLLSTMLLSSCGNEPAQEPIGHKTVSYTINFSNIDLGESKQIFGTQDAFKNKILEAINIDLEEPILLDVTTSENNSVKIEQSDFISGYTNVQGLIVGTANYDGSINFKFAKELLSVTIKAEQYYNIYTGYSSGTPSPEIHYDGQELVDNPDGEDYYQGVFKIGVNTQEFKGPGKTYVYDEEWHLIIDLPESKTETFEINDDELTIDGYAKYRTRIYEMTFEFEA